MTRQFFSYKRKRFEQNRRSYASHFSLHRVCSVEMWFCARLQSPDYWLWNARCFTVCFFFPPYLRWKWFTFAFLTLLTAELALQVQMWLLAVTLQKTRISSHINGVSFYHSQKRCRMWCSILKESLSMYGRVWNFIRTIIFALFVTTCKKRYNKNLFDIHSISLFCNCTKSGLTTE